MNGRCCPFGRIEEPCRVSNRMPVSMRRKTRAAYSARVGRSQLFVADFGIGVHNGIAFGPRSGQRNFTIGGTNERIESEVARITPSKARSGLFHFCFGNVPGPAGIGWRNVSQMRSAAF